MSQCNRNQLSRSYRRMVGCDVSLSCHGVVAQLWRSYGAVMAQVSRSSRAVIAQLWRSYGAVMAQLWRSYGADMAQLSRSSRAVLVRSLFVVSRDTTRMCRVVVAVDWFVSSDWVLVQLSRRYRGILVCVLTDTCCTISNTFREDSNTRREVWNRTSSDMKLLLK